jgi:hypothetical protein
MVLWCTQGNLNCVYVPATSDLQKLGALGLQSSSVVILQWLVLGTKVQLLLLLGRTLWRTVRSFLLSPSLFYLPVHSRCRGFLFFHLITLRHTPQSVGFLWTRDQPVAETSTWQHKHCARQTAMPPVGFEPTIPASARPQAYGLDRATTGISRIVRCV